MHGPGVDEPIVWYEGAGTSDRRYLITDHQGSVIAENGASTVHYNYGPYGEPNAWVGSRFRYTGQAALPELQLYHYKARVYDPVLGRFLQTDPVGYEDDLNLYAYVQNDPLNRADPSGKCRSVADRDKRAECLVRREEAVQQAREHLREQSVREGRPEAAFIATWNENTGEVTLRVGDEAAERTNEDVDFKDSDGGELRARPDGRIVRRGDDGADQNTSEIVLATGHSHPRDRSGSPGISLTNRANESLRNNPKDQALSQVAPAVIITPSGRIRVFVNGREL